MTVRGNRGLHFSIVSSFRLLRFNADADTVQDMMKDGQLVSDALSRAGVRHRFEIYDDQNSLAGYFHYEWPSTRTL